MDRDKYDSFISLYIFESYTNNEYKYTNKRSTGNNSIIIDRRFLITGIFNL